MKQVSEHNHFYVSACLINSFFIFFLIVLFDCGFYCVSILFLLFIAFSIRMQNRLQHLSVRPESNRRNP